MKRLISLILTIAMLLSLAPAVFAEETQTTAGAALEFGTPVEKTATEYNTNNSVTYYEIPVIFKNDTEQDIKLSMFECHINYDVLGLEPVNVQVDELDWLGVATYESYVAKWTPEQNASDGLAIVTATTNSSNYHKTVKSQETFVLFKLNLKRVASVENGDYQLKFADPYYKNNMLVCNLAGSDYENESSDYSQSANTLDCASTATITVTDGANPTLKSVSVDTTAGNPVYGTAQSFDLKAISTSDKDITSLVTWSVTPADAITIEDGKAKTSASTPAGDYEIKGTYGDNSFETTLTVDKAKLDSVSLTLDGYEKGKLVSGATVTGDYCTVPEGGYKWNDDVPASNDKFQAATSYKLSVAFTVDNNYLLEGGSNATLYVGNEYVTGTVSYGNNCFIADFQLPETGSKDTVTITTPPTASEATYGDTLKNVTLSNGEASVAGTFAWTNGDQSVGSAGNNSFEVTFTPNDSDMFANATADVTVKVDPKSIEANDVTIDEIPGQSYTGQEIQPTLTIKFKGETLTHGTDFSTEYDNNKECGTATVKIIGNGNFTGETTKTFQITKSIASCDITLRPAEGTGYTYTGNEIKPTVTVKDGDKPLTQDTDYTVSYSGNTKAGTATVTVSGKGNYTGTATAHFDIAKKQINVVVNANVSPITKWYDGGNLALAHFKLEDGSVVGNDDVQIANAGSVQVTFNDPYVGENKTVTIEKMELTGNDAGNYELIQPTGLTGSITAPRRTLTTTTSEESPTTLTKGGRELDLTTLVTSVPAGTSDLTFQIGDQNPYGCTLSGSTLTSGTQFGDSLTSVTVSGGAIDVNGDGNAEYTAAEPLTIYVKVVDKLEAGLSVATIPTKMTYGNEKSWTSSVTCSDKSGETVATSSNEAVIKVKEDGTLLAVGVGTAKVTFTYDTAEYYGTKSYNIEVEARPISVTADNKEIVYGDPDPTLTFNLTDDTNRLVNGDTLDSLHITASIEGEDRNAGTHTIKLSQNPTNANYTVELKVGTLTITKAPLTITNAAVQGKTYDGTNTATVTGVTFEGLKNNEALTMGTDFTATGTFNNANAGENKPVAVKVTLKETDLTKNYTLSNDTYTGEKGTITKRDTSVTVTVETSVTYTGSAFARANYRADSANAKFEFYSDNNGQIGTKLDSAPVNAGTYWIKAIVEENDNENASSDQKQFVISPKALTDSDITVDAIPDQTYTGVPITPNVTVKYNGMKLEAGKDYAVVPSGDCTNVGTATVHINGKGNYTGIAPQTFQIVAKPVEGVTVTVADTDLVYDKTAKTPTVTVGSGATLIPADNYTVAYSNNVSAGTATATVTFTGNYSGTATGTFTIAPKTIDDLTWTGDTFYYDKNEKTVTATANGLIEGDEAAVTVTGGKQTAIGSYIATAAKLDNTNYTLPTSGLTHNFTIKNAIESISVVAFVSGQEGESKTITATVDGLTIKLTGTKKENETLKLTINGAEHYVANSAETVTVTVAGQDFPYKLDKSDLKTTPNDVKLDEKPADVPDAPENASDDLKQAVAAVKSEGGASSSGLAAAAAAAVTSEAAKKDTSEESKEVKADVKLEIEVKDYEKTEGKSVLTLEITPTVTYTYKDESGAQKTETETISNSDIKAPVTISVKLPNGMPTDNLFVKHELKNGGVEYLKVTVDNGVATWQQSSFSTAILMSDNRTVTITLVKDNGDQITMTLDRASGGTALPKDGTKTNWKFDGIDGSYSTITNELFETLAKMSSTITARSVSGSSSEPDDKPSKPGSSSSGPLLPSLGDDELLFRDVSKYDYYYNAVKWAVKKGVTSGTGRYTFSPDDACTRAQTVTFLWRAAGCPKASTKTNPFTDVASSDYFYEAVLWAVENGITNGTSSTTFSPNASVTRAQVAAFLWRANGEPAARDSGFADVASNAYYAKAVAWAYAEGITTGTGFGVFSPDSVCTRAQIVTFLFRNAK